MHQPVRQCLGKLLLDVGRLPQAEEAYRADLRVFPENGWSLLGLYHSIMFQVHVYGFRVLGFRVLGFRVLGF